MSSTIDLLEEQGAGYGRHGLQHGCRPDELAHANNLTRVERFVTAPMHTSWLGVSHLGQRRFPRSIGSAYALAIVGIVFFPFILESAAVLLALVYMISRRWEIAMLQLGIAFAALVFARLGHSLVVSVAPVVGRALGI